jgi:hypothetical protein
MLLQNTTITLFTYSKQDPCLVETPFKQCPFSDKIESNQNPTSDIINHSVLATDRSLPTIVEMNDSTADPTDSSIFTTAYNKHKSQQQYSQNATQSYLNTPKKQNSVFDTAVIIDVTKCPQIPTTQPDLIHQPSIQNNWNHIQPTFHNKQEYIPNQPIYFNQYLPQTMYLPWSQNSNYSNHQQQISTDTIFYNPVS